MASAARRPERMAPSIVPAKASVCSPAKWTRPSGRRSAAWKRFTCAGAYATAVPWLQPSVCQETVSPRS